MNPPRVILFDWDDTLVDNFVCIHAALNAALTAMGHQQWTFAEFQAWRGPSVRDLFPQMFGNRAGEARRIFYAAFEAGHLKTLKALPGAREMLAALHQAGLVLGVVSNKIGHYLRREVAHLEWSGYFHRLVGAMDAARDKPAAEPVWLALEGMGVPPGDDVWFVGDSLTDMKCAYNAGCCPVLLRLRPPDEEEFTRFRPSCYFSHCNAIIRAVYELLIPKSRF